MAPTEVVITGIGVISPVGVGRDCYWDSLLAGRSGVTSVRVAEECGVPCTFAGEVTGFEPKQYVRPRKSLKVMARDAHLGVAAAELARRDAGLGDGVPDPERFGVVLGADQIINPLEEAVDPYLACINNGEFDFELWGHGAMPLGYPLAFLRILPNMIASHVSIAQDARGPNNTIHHSDVSSLLAISEAARVIRRGAADVMMAGGTSSQMSPVDWARRRVFQPLSKRTDDPTAAMRPFDADRDGMVWGEGAAVFVLESRPHAMRRGANILARMLGWSSCHEPCAINKLPGGRALRRAIAGALDSAELAPGDLGHVNAHGWSTPEHDRVEAHAIRGLLGPVPVTAPRSMLGNLHAAAGAVELGASVLSFQNGAVPATLNYERPDPECPVEVIVREPLTGSAATALALNWTSFGQVAALVLAGPN